MMSPLRTGPWNLTDLDAVPKNGKTVFSIFHCGGGSTMGYKLAGYDVLGGVEIDPKMMAIYKANHKPKYSYEMDIREFNRMSKESLPAELFDLDILDGSPPCSSFSMAGSREKAWGKNKSFREGQAKQVLDDLFFYFINTAKRLQPKVVIAENVKGLIQGHAKGYVKQIAAAFDDAGYDVQLFLLNAAFMGVPQRRERTFFIAKKKSIAWPKLELNFNEKLISTFKAISHLPSLPETKSKLQRKYYFMSKEGDSFSKVHPNKSWFNSIKLNRNSPANTLAASGGLFHYSECRKLSDQECIKIQSFPDDFNLLNLSGQYICGMSVPPFMMQRVATEVLKQWLIHPVSLVSVQPHDKPLEAIVQS